MRVLLLAFVALFAAAPPTVGRAAASEQQPAPNPKTPKILTLIGCVVPDPDRPGAFTLSNNEEGIRYRLTGTSVSDYAGRRVQVSGPTPKRLRVVGGLYPSPNVAAQGGSDPTKAAIAAMEPNAGTKGLAEFSVKSVRAVSGGCTE